MHKVVLEAIIKSETDASDWHPDSQKALAEEIMLALVLYMKKEAGDAQPF